MLWICFSFKLKLLHCVNMQVHYLNQEKTNDEEESFHYLSTTFDYSLMEMTLWWSADIFWILNKGRGEMMNHYISIYLCKDIILWKKGFWCFLGKEATMEESM